MARKSEIEPEDRKALIELLKKGNWTIWTKVEAVNRDGTARWIDCYVMGTEYTHDGQITGLPIRINWYLEKLGIAKRARKHDGALYVSGCGMDMCFETVYRTSYRLFADHPEEFTGTTTNIQWSQESNDYVASKDAGYFLRYRSF